MTKFEAKIPEYIKQLEKDISDIRNEMYDIDWGHECDCDFCDEPQQSEEDREIAETEKKRIEDEIAQVELTINRLKRHAKWHKVKI